MNKSKVIVSFLMCTNAYNDKFIDALNSCLNQTISDLEVVLVVNGLGQSDREKIFNFCKDPRIVVIFSEAQYLTYNLNLGLEYCSANYVARMDSDDICDPRRVERQISFMNNNKSVAVCGSSYRLVNERNEILDTVHLPIENVKIRRALYYTNPIAHPSVMFRKDIILSLGGYMGGKYAQDYDLWLRVSNETNYQFHNLGEALIDYRSMGGNARYSREAYSYVSAAQWRLFAITLNPLWFFSSIYNFIRVLFR